MRTPLQIEVPDRAEFVACYIAQRLMDCQQGPPEDPKTWAKVADARGHLWEYFRDYWSAQGEFLTTEPLTGLIRINTIFAPELQAHAFVHELAHAELNALPSSLTIGEVPGYFGGAWMCGRCGYDDEPDCIGHQVAQRVEEICFSQSCPLPVFSEDI